MLGTNLLHSARLALTALYEADMPTIERWYSDAEFLRLLDAMPAAPRAAASLREWVEEHQKSQNGYLFGIRLHDEQLIGVVELNDILWNHRCGWLMIGLGEPAYRGLGYGAEALGLALDFAFAELNLHRVQLTVFSYNQRAIALYERLGFQREGAYREFLQRDGQRFDMYLYGLLRHEWAPRSPAP